MARDRLGITKGRTQRKQNSIFLYIDYTQVCDYQWTRKWIESWVTRHLAIFMATQRYI